ncbi:MAG: hypothetical protein ACI8SE_001729, partial [Bacteroidia bacterium]
MKLSALFGNQKKLVKTLDQAERRIYYRLIAVSLVS